MTHFVPRTLADVGRARDAQEFTAFLKEVVDRIVHHARVEGFRFRDDLPLPPDLIVDPPPSSLQPWMRAYLCAMAEHLSDMAGMAPPRWSDDGFLAEPVFFGGRHSRDQVLKDTPPAFRRRLVFPGRVLMKLETLRQDVA